jgi:hypothetical protein
MTGPEHYQEAERCLLEDGCEYGCPHSGCEHEMRLIARAQAHATLANAAAFALSRFGEMPAHDAEEWLRAAKTNAADGPGQVADVTFGALGSGPGLGQA